MNDLARERDNFLRLSSDAKERGMLVVADAYQEAAMKISLQRIQLALSQMRRE